MDETAPVREKRNPIEDRCDSVQYVIVDNCTGCAICVQNCPSNAIKGESRRQHVIDQTLCECCGICKQVCKYHAVKVYS